MKTINLIVPQGWHELGDKQLRYVYSLIAKEFAADEIKTLALLRFSDCKVIARHDKNSFLLKHGKDVFQTSGTQLAEVIPSLGWLDAIPTSPVRLRKLRNHASVDAEFQGVSRYASRHRRYGRSQRVHGNNARAVPTTDVGAHSGESQVRAELHLP